MGIIADRSPSVNSSPAPAHWTTTVDRRGRVLSTDRPDDRAPVPLVPGEGMGAAGDQSPSDADRAWLARRNADWHDQGADMECGFTEYDDATDYGHERWDEPDEVVVERYFRPRSRSTRVDPAEEAMLWGGYPS